LVTARLERRIVVLASNFTESGDVGADVKHLEVHRLADFDAFLHVIGPGVFHSLFLSAGASPVGA
jgi:hypothetical protein